MAPRHFQALVPQLINASIDNIIVGLAIPNECFILEQPVLMMLQFLSKPADTVQPLCGVSEVLSDFPKSLSGLLSFGSELGHSGFQLGQPGIPGGQPWQTRRAH